MSHLVLVGFLLAILSGVMNGTFTLPMKFLGRWSWENVWTVFVLISCVLMPVVMVAITVPDSLAILSQVPRPALRSAAVAGFLWGFGAILFGQSVSAIGISLANTLVLALSSSIGSALPLLILDRTKVWQPQGQMLLGGVTVCLAGIALCGWAGRLRERSPALNGESARGNMVGHRRPLGVAFLFCVLAGFLSGVFNIGYSLAQPVITVAGRAGIGPFAGSNLIWLIMLEAGAMANLGFCGWLLLKNGTFRNFAQARTLPLYALSAVMGLLWGGSIFAYGAGSSRLGKLGPAIGWPLSLATGLLVANLCGAITGEWRGAAASARRIMAVGIVILVIAIAILGLAAHLQ